MTNIPRRNIIAMATTINAAVVAPAIVAGIIILVCNDKLTRKVSNNVCMLVNAFSGIEPMKTVVEAKVKDANKDQ